MKIFAAILEWTGILTVIYTFIGLIAGAFGYVLVLENATFPLINFNLAVILIPIGLLLIVIGWLISINTKDNAITPFLDMNDLSFIEKVIRKTALRNFWVGLFLLVFGFILCVTPLLDKQAISIGGNIFIIIFGSLCIFLGLFMIFKWAKMRIPQKSKEWNLIMIEPHKIDEIKVQIFQNEMGKVNQAINVNFIRANKIKAVLAVNEEQLHLLKQYLLKVNPGIKIN